MRSKKSQAAMEFLMTYGWAILVVLVAIGALAYFGVLSPDRFLPSKCVLPAGLACIDFNIEPGTVTVVLRNGLGADLTGVTMITGSCTVSSSISIANGEKGTLLATSCGLTAGAKFNEAVNVTYTNTESDLTKKISGTITGRVQ